MSCSTVHGVKSHRLYDERHRVLAAQAAGQGGVVSRRQAYRHITRWEVRAHVRARRWQLIGDQVVVLHSGPVTAEGMHWAAVFQGGPRARLDGASALVAGGLERFHVDRIRQRHGVRLSSTSGRPGAGVPRTESTSASHGSHLPLQQCTRLSGRGPTDRRPSSSP
jgi:hypothetical protein